MTKKLQIYKCEICGNIVEVVNEGAGELVCCGKPMKLLEEKTSDSGMEKHVPVIEKTDRGVKIKVGEIPHPMEENHFIQWIEVISNGRLYKKELHPGEKPEAEFNITPENLEVRIYCNLHGLWKNSF
jgi:superoxide reductase